MVQFSEMMFVLRRLFLLFVIGLAVYCFWPRTSSMAGFDPERMAELQIAVWKATADKKPQSALMPLYHIYNGQYRLPPVSALKMSFDTVRALRLFHTSPDAAGQEKALLPLQTVFVTLRSGTKSSFDSNAAARMELLIWMLRADRAKRAQLTTAWSESLALLYGCSVEECLPAAKQFSIASKLADEGKWSEAQSGALEAWKLVLGIGRHLASGSG
ncbi:MAG: hypothetical protein WC003_14560 [Terrimicrobiaceae bacterium]